MVNVNEIINECKWIDKDYGIITPVITIQGKTIATEGNFITLNGLPKSRKTTFLQFFIYSALTGNEIFGIKAHIQKEDKICIIDTEQTIHDFQRQTNNLKKIIGVKSLPNNFSAYLFRKYEPNVIIESIYNIIVNDRPKILCIDNLTELVINPNDMNEAKAVIQFLKKITAEFNIVVICLLHLGKGNLQTLGNLGSMADRGAQSVLRVVYEQETGGSIIEPVFLRSDSHFNPIQIMYDNESKTYFTTEASIKKSSKKFVLNNLTNEDHNNRLNVIFLNMNEISYGELVEAIKQLYGVGTNIAKQQVIPYLTGNKFLIANKGIYKLNK
jgi:hypothetical protein